MEQVITLTDIAKEAGVSTASVHRALYGKKGISEETRKKIIAICNKNGYQTNTSASLLKRKKLRIVIAFPGLTNENKYYYQNIWNGFRKWKEEMRSYPIEIEELSYYLGVRNNQAQVLAESLDMWKGEIDGLITVGHFNSDAKKIIEKYKEKSIPIFLVTDDYPESGRIACVQTDYVMLGQMVAELISSQLSNQDEILLLTGDPIIPSHYKIVEGFCSYLKNHQLPLKVCKIDGYFNEKTLSERISHILQTNKHIRAAFGVSARISILLANQIEALNLSNTVRAIGSDVFDESLVLLDKGIFKNLVFKNPQKQAYDVANLLFRYLVMNEKPIEETIYEHSHLIFQSEVCSYQ